MGNTYFQFKQFRIEQDQCAMKVSTDACILGAFTPAPQAGYVLDIGTGTGLLSLMLAQRCQCEIDAIELDDASFMQATQNVYESEWKNRISVQLADIRTFHTDKTYDLIICNPPFFENHLRSGISRRNIARHADQLRFHELIAAVISNLNPKGQFAVLLPSDFSERFISLSANAGLKVMQQVMIRDTALHQPFRTIIIFSLRNDQQPETTSLIIRDASGNYSRQFTTLLSPYYLHL